MIGLKALVRISFFEFIRDRMVWLSVFVAVALLLFSLLLGSLSFQEQQRILAHFGWMAIQLSGIGIGLFLGAQWLHKEMDRQTCLLVLARPISRGQLFFGKYLGILLILFFIEAFLALALQFLLKFSMFNIQFLQIFLGTFLEILIVFSITFFASTFLRPALSFFLGLSVFLVGNWIQEIQFFGEKIKSGFYVSLAEFVGWICPHLFQMNWRSVYFLENGVPADQVLWVLFHSAAWIGLSISCGILIFKRRDLV